MKEKKSMKKAFFKNFGSCQFIWERKIIIEAINGIQIFQVSMDQTVQGS